MFLPRLFFLRFEDDAVVWRGDQRKQFGGSMPQAGTHRLSLKPVTSIQASEIDAFYWLVMLRDEPP